MKFSDIPQHIMPGSYQMNVPWIHLERTLNDLNQDVGLVLEPDFKRNHVWTEDQERAYVEFILKGGQSSRTLYFNSAHWMQGKFEPIYCVDGLQRLTAVRKFLNDDLWIFRNHYYSDFEDTLPMKYDFIFNINNLVRRREVLRWYIQLNSGGTPHTAAEIDRAWDLYSAELLSPSD